MCQHGLVSNIPHILDTTIVAECEGCVKLAMTLAMTSHFRRLFVDQPEVLIERIEGGERAPIFLVGF